MKIVAPILTGIVLVGLAIWFLAIGGIVQVVNGATAHPVDATGIAVGAVRFFCTTLGVWAGIALSVALGVALDD
jgi:hypothetical protein